MFVMKQTELKFTCSHMVEIFFVADLSGYSRLRSTCTKTLTIPAAATEARRLRRIEAKRAVDVICGCEWQKR
jgi:hypothetical protein